MRRLLNFFRMKAVEAEIREELEFHRSQSSGSFGNVTQIYEQAREAALVSPVCDPYTPSPCAS